jgi:hypothetical protein
VYLRASAPPSFAPSESTLLNKVALVFLLQSLNLGKRVDTDQGAYSSGFPSGGNVSQAAEGGLQGQTKQKSLPMSGMTAGVGVASANLGQAKSEPGPGDISVKPGQQGSSM